MRTATKKIPRFIALSLALLLLAAFVPLTGARAVPASVQMQYGFDLQTALSKATSNGTSPAYDEIDHLYLTGNGKLTREDGVWLRSALPNLTLLDLSGYEGEFGPEAFAENGSLRQVVLPEGAKLSRRMFFACSALEEVTWPGRYTLANDCFSYCALDFSGGYPALLNDNNVGTYAAHQRPVAYLSLPNGESGILRAGEEFTNPTLLQTRLGTDYRALVEQKPAWLVTLPGDLAVGETYYYNGNRVEELNLSEPGIYNIIYSLPGTTTANTHNLSYTLTVLTAEGVLPVELLGLPGEVRVGESFELSCVSPGAEDANCWNWDAEFFDAKFESPATFTPKQTGSSVITFTGPGGETGQVQVDVLPAASGDDVVPVIQGNGSIRWILPIGIFIVVIGFGVMIALWLRQRPSKKAPAGGAPSGKAPPPEKPVETIVSGAQAEEPPQVDEAPADVVEPAETVEEASTQAVETAISAEDAPVEAVETAVRAEETASVNVPAASTVSRQNAAQGSRKKKKGKKKRKKPQSGAGAPEKDNG